MNTKRVLAHVGAIMSIVGSAIFAFIFLISLPSVELAVRIEFEGMMVSEEQLNFIITYTTIMLVILAVFAGVILGISITSEVKVCKKKNPKGFLIALLVLDVLYSVILGLSQQILGLLLFVAAAIVLLVSLCLKEEVQNHATEIEQKHDNENVLF